MANNITYNDAKVFINVGRYTEALPLLEALAAQNDLTAMNTLGFLYRDGKGVKKET